MKIICTCGYQILDSTDSLTHKGHCIPDQLWLPVADQIDAVIESSGSGAKEKEAACMRIREILVRSAYSIWQCSQCGSLYVDDEKRQIHQFTPASESASKRIFARREKKEPIQLPEPMSGLAPGHGSS